MKLNLNMRGIWNLSIKTNDVTRSISTGVMAFLHAHHRFIGKYRETNIDLWETWVQFCFGSYALLCNEIPWWISTVKTGEHFGNCIVVLRTSYIVSISLSLSLSYARTHTYTHKYSTYWHIYNIYIGLYTYLCENLYVSVSVAYVNVVCISLWWCG